MASSTAATRAGPSASLTARSPLPLVPMVPPCDEPLDHGVCKEVAGCPQSDRGAAVDRIPAVPVFALKRCPFEREAGFLQDGLPRFLGWQ